MSQKKNLFNNELITIGKSCLTKMWNLLYFLQPLNEQYHLPTSLCPLSPYSGRCARAAYAECPACSFCILRLRTKARAEEDQARSGDPSLVAVCPYWCNTGQFAFDLKLTNIERHFLNVTKVSLKLETHHLIWVFMITFPNRKKFAFIDAVLA